MNLRRTHTHAHRHTATLISLDQHSSARRPRQAYFQRNIKRPAHYHSFQLEAQDFITATPQAAGFKHLQTDGQADVKVRALNSLLQSLLMIERR